MNNAFGGSKSCKYRFAKFVNVAEENGAISPLVHIGQFQKDCEAILPGSELDFHKKEFTVQHLSKEMGVTEDIVKELEEVCSPDVLACPREDEVINWDDHHSVPSDLGLVSVQYWSKIHELRHTPDTPLYKMRQSVSISKYSPMDCALQVQAAEVPVKSDEDRVTCPEVVITVKVGLGLKTRSTKACGVDFLVLGSQKLTELRDRIPCPLDHQPVGGDIGRKQNDQGLKLKDICKSSSFFIENTFYNDLRSPRNVDLSRSIIKWSKTAKTTVPSMPRCCRMEDCTFNDLKVRLGCPYTFLHLGDCEHIIIFKDIRLFHDNDCQSRSAYPVTVARAKVPGKLCQLCGLNLATWSTSDDELAESDPALFCGRCFRTLHYDKDGKELGRFRAFRRVNVEELEY